MIALNETDPTAAEIPFFLPLTADTFTGPGLTGHVFVLGEVQIKLPGAGWVNADLAAIVEKGYGRYCVRLTSAQTGTSGIVYLRANVAGAQPYSGVEEISIAGGDILQNAAARIPFYLASRTDPVNTAITGWVFTTGEARICVPGGSYVDAAVTNIVEVGYGAYELVLTAGQTAGRGKVFIYVLTATAQRYESASTVLSPQAATTPTVVAYTPSTDTAPGAAGGFPAAFSTASMTPVVIDITGSVLAYATLSIGNTLVYHGGVFVGDYVSRSSQVTIAGGIRLSILPSSGWPEAADPTQISYISVSVDAVDTGGGAVSTTLVYRLPPGATAQGSITYIVAATGAVDQVAVAISRLCEYAKEKAA